MADELERWLDAVSPELRPMIDRLRAIVRAAAPTLRESIKWNAPSFADGAHDRVTLGIERKGGVRIVLHRGAAKSHVTIPFDDTDRVAKWPSSDRGVATFASLAALEAKSAALEALVRRWVMASREG